MTAKILRKEGATDCADNERGAGCREAKRLALVKLRTLMTSGGRNRKQPGSNSQKPEGYNSKFNRAIRRILKFRACKKALSDAVEKECAAEEEHYGPLRDPVVHTTFEERQFGDLNTTSRDFPCSTTFKKRKFGDPITTSRDSPCSVVSIAVFDGDTMLFACSGIPLPRGRSKLEITRYVTSARLATEYESKQYRDDKLKIVVRLPNDRKKGGFIELCNHHIAIVTLLDRQAGHPIMVTELQAEYPSEGDEMLSVGGDEMLSVGRAFESGCLMAAKVKLASLCEGWFDEVRRFDEVRLDPPNSDERFSLWKPVSSYEGGPLAVLGGPVLGKDNRIIGMSIEVDRSGAYVSFILLEHLIRYLEYFQILIPKNLHQYSWPKGLKNVIPSAFVSKIYRLRHLGYPMPPPLMLEFNGQLLNQFEDLFGDVRAWKGYPFGSPIRHAEPVWRHLRKDVVKDISRRVVSIASFHGYERYFACTGLLIKWHGCTVVLTSASLVRSCNDEDRYENEIDNDLKIEVFLPPKQRASGKLELYSLKYNIAIVSLEKKFISICPEDISSKYSTRKSSAKVVAVGSEPLDGLLMASIGKVKRPDMDCKLDCRYLKLSTCKMKKVLLLILMGILLA